MSLYELYIPRIVKSLKSTYGEEFFNTLTLQLNDIVGADYTFIARLNKKKYTSQTISLVAKGSVVDNFEYALEDTPCKDVSDDSLCIYPKEICSLYPKDQLLIDMKIEGYIGTPLKDSKGEVMGLIVALYEQEIEDGEFIATLFDFFSGRVAAELERAEHEKTLKVLNETLEHKVQQRTKELSEALEHLKQSQQTIIEQEKMASLGNLVAGVAHEINTPLGISILSASHIGETIEKIESKLVTQSLSKSELEKKLSDIGHSHETLAYNLNRTAQLVQDFKLVAIDRSLDDLREIEIKPWLERLISSLQPILKKKHISLILDIDDTVPKINTFPSKLSQVFTNLIINSVTHAFPSSQAIENKNITIKVSQKKTGLEIHVIDNGIGIAKEIKNEIFQPFFTTNRAEGNTGLGLSIISNIVTGNLQGSIKCKSNDNTDFVVNLPFEIQT